jgi:CRISPR system Cascade subunit CasA
MSEFNLIDEPWILVRDADCNIKEVGLQDAIINAHSYTGLAGETKTQDFAVLRLLLAVMYTVFSRYNSDGYEIGIEDEDIDYPVDNWESIWNAKKIPEKAIKSYFDKWRDRFRLFDDKHPFYQSNAVNGKGNPYNAAKMIGSLFESGNKARLFSGREKDGRMLTYSEAARWLLHVICFDDIAAKQPTPKKAWVSTLGLIALHGNNLFETIMLNYVADANEEAINCRPYWEQESTIEEFNHIIAVPSEQAELLTLQSRRVYLCREKDKVVGYYLSGGDYFEETDVKSEQMTLWVKDDKVKTEIKLKPRRHTQLLKSWQEFGSIAESGLNSDDTSKRIPGVISWVKRLREYDILESSYMLKVITASVIYDLGQSTSLPVIDSVSDTLTFHSQLLLDAGDIWRNRIYDEIGKCKHIADKISILSINLQIASGASGKLDGDNAKEQFYSRIDGTFRIWLAELKTDFGEDYMGTLERKLRGIALKFGNELTYQAGDSAVFGRYVKTSDSKTGEEKLYSSAQLLDYFCSDVNKIFNRAGDINE